MSLCRSVFCGNVVRDFEVKQGKTGTPYAQFVLGVNVGYGEKAYSNFFTCIGYGKTAEALGKYVTKGTKLIVECEPRQQRWKDKDGNNMSREIHMINNWWFAESRNVQQATQQTQAQQSAQQQPVNQPVQQQAQQPTSQPVSQPQSQPQANAKPWDSMPDYGNDLPFV